MQNLCECSGSNRGEITRGFLLSLGSLHSCCWTTSTGRDLGRVLLASVSSLLFFLPPTFPLLFSLPPFLPPSSLPSSFPPSLPYISCNFSPWNLTFFPAKWGKQSFHRHLWMFHHCAKLTIAIKFNKPKPCPTGTHNLEQVFSTGGNFTPPRHIWQCLETFLMVMVWGGCHWN